MGAKKSILVHTYSNAIELEFAIDIGLLLLDIGGSVNGSHIDERKDYWVPLKKRKSKQI
jgi:hypothetical protein